MKFLSYLMSFLIAASSVHAQSGFCTTAPDDGFEDNDICATATPLGDGTYPGLWLHRFDPDFYRMCVLPGATLQTDCVFADNVLALQAQLTADCSGQQVGTRTINVDLVRWRYTNQTAVAQHVTLHVFHHPTVVLIECGNYELTITGSGSCTLGAVFCDPGGVNSAGSVASLSGSFGGGVGSDLHLEATGGPPGSFGYFLVSQAFVQPGNPVGQGMLCLTDPIGRYNGGTGPAFNSIGSFDASGRFQNLGGSSTVGSGFDVPSLVPLIGATIQPGDTWNFQLWYRDALPGSPPTSNLTEGLSVTF